MNENYRGKYHQGIARLRGLNGRLEQLEARAQSLPPEKRTEIDTRTEKIKERKKMLLLLLSRFENSPEEEQTRLREKIDRDIENIRGWLDKIREMITRAESI
jgi:hypothetical protein